MGTYFIGAAFVLAVFTTIATAGHFLLYAGDVKPERPVPDDSGVEVVSCQG